MYVTKLLLCAAIIILAIKVVLMCR